MGLEYATGGKMEVLGRKIVIIEKDDQIKPDIAKSALAAAYGDDKVDIAVGPDLARRRRSRCCRWPRSTRRSCWSSRRWPTRSPATSGTATSSAPAATRRRTRSPARWRTPQNAQIAMLAQDYAFGRDGVKAFKEALAAIGSKAHDRARGIRAAGDHRLHRACAAHVRRAQGQAGPQDHRHHLGRRQPGDQDRRPQARALRHRARARAATSCR